MIRKFYLLPAVALFAVIPRLVAAHCPLCTAGAGALAVLASSLGVSSVIVGLLIGAFALALGLWLASLPIKEYFPGQSALIIILIFLSTVVPIMPLVRDYGPLYLALGGPYGSAFHKTYVIDLYAFGIVLGAVIMGLAPLLSRWFSRRQGNTWPYQGLVITFSLLIIISLVIQFWPWLA